MAVHDSAALAAGHYIDWGVISISVTNAAIIGLMVVVFVLALLLPFPRPREERQQVEEEQR
ncbi:hypothetical protein [Nocardioides panaciterrulae]|uniref:Uncharacterized protein n=1 Tax=Nocardioides panaciterrulae TaxID=661492 RepID=A0A7Y9JA09_9ACTN|nr:hypothetical protein [Nocardioides panaciterrulae]NYD40626.1 hypothetical protein [Nocardioides panaciterrulae]